MEILKQLVKWARVSIQQINYINLPITKFNPLDDNGEEQLNNANLVLEHLLLNAKEQKIKRAGKGGISKHYKNMLNIFEVANSTRGYEILTHINGLGWARIQVMCRNMIEKVEKPISGTQALRKLIEEIPVIKKYACPDEQESHKFRIAAKKFYNTDICESGESFEGIPASMQKLTCNREFNNVWSLDFHWAFPSALAEIIPETRPAIEKLYQQRKTDESIKAIGVEAIGCMCSESTVLMGYSKEAFAELRYYILEHHNEKLHYIANLIEQQGGHVINYRTDSIKFIWNFNYAPKLPYQGPGLGQWSYEFINAHYRQLSTGRYEYEYNGKYKAVLNGKTKLDRIKPRDEWQWGDILRKECNEEIKFTYNRFEHKFKLGGN